LPTGRRKLLLADDSPTVQKVVSLTFDDEGFQVVAVATGAQALAELERDVPDVVLADVHMPAPDGYELCARIKRDARTSHVPVVLLVGAFEPFDEAEARKSGADEVLTKPFQSIRELVNKVGGLLGGQPEAKKADERADEPTGELRAANADDSHAVEASSEAQHAASNDEGARADNAAPAFADFGMDDADIETMPADEFAAHQTAQAAHDFAGSRVSLDARDTNAGEFSTRDAAPARSSTGGAQSFAAAASSKSHAPGFDARADAAAAADDALLELGDIDSSRARAAATDDFVLDIGDDDDAYAPQHAAMREPTLPESLYDDDAPSAVEMQAAGSTSMAEPAAVWNAAQEFAVSPDAITVQVEAPAQVEPEATAQTFDEATQTFDDATASGAVEMFDEPDAHEPTASNVATISEPQSPAQPQPSTQAGALQLSPETIETIARRVVEHLSERVVREIAWEVVPDLAERLIRRKLEEEQTRAK
jgi:CheY-like chemotaxis protein